MYKGEFTWKIVAVFCTLLLSCSLVSGQTVPTQTTTAPEKLTPAEKRANAKAAAQAKAEQAKEARAAKATPATATRATPATSTPTAAATSAASALPATTPATAASAATSNALPSRSGATSAASNSGTRSALTTQGLGSFRGADYTIVAYGCYRAASSVLCDFDLTKARPAQSGTQPFNNIVVVDDGGKINHRGNAYYMGTDGTHMESAYLSGTPVRYVMEFDGVGQQTSSVSLVRAANRIDNVPVKAAAAATTPTTTK